MTLRPYQLIFFVILAGCGKQSPDPGPLIVIPGQGIPKVAELGMSLKEIHRAVPDLKFRSYPETGFPWQRNVIGDRRRLPWEKPLHLTAESRSLGLVCSEDNNDKPVQSLFFFSDPDPIMTDSNTWFTGQLSGGLSFANRRRATRAEVVAVFGEPLVRRMEVGIEGVKLLQDGISLSVVSNTGNGVENLCYPTSGIDFCLRHDLVISFQIRPKIKKLETKH